MGRKYAIFSSWTIDRVFFVRPGIFEPMRALKTTIQLSQLLISPHIFIELILRVGYFIDRYSQLEIMLIWQAKVSARALYAMSGWRRGAIDAEFTWTWSFWAWTDNVLFIGVGGRRYLWSRCRFKTAAAPLTGSILTTFSVTNNHLRVGTGL